MSDWSSDVCSSDLDAQSANLSARQAARDRAAAFPVRGRQLAADHGPDAAVRLCDHADDVGRDGRGRCRPRRSEEHTSELQSLMRISYAVFCLKKKKKQITNKCTNT